MEHQITERVITQVEQTVGALTRPNRLAVVRIAALIAGAARKREGAHVPFTFATEAKDSGAGKPLILEGRAEQREIRVAPERMRRSAPEEAIIERTGHSLDLKSERTAQRHRECALAVPREPAAFVSRHLAVAEIDTAFEIWLGNCRFAFLRASSAQGRAENGCQCGGACGHR